MEEEEIFCYQLVIEDETYRYGGLEELIIPELPSHEEESLHLTASQPL